MKEEILSAYTFPTKPSSDGFYHIYVPDPTKKSGRRQIKASTLEILKQKVYSVEKGINGVARKTFEEVFRLYQADYGKYVRNAEKQFSVNNTISRRNSEFRRYYEGSWFASMYMDEITGRDIKTYLVYLLDSKPMSKSAYLEASGLIRVTFKWAADEGLIDENPSLLVNYYSQKIQNMWVEPKSIEDRIYSDEEIGIFLSECHKRQQTRPRNITPYALEFQILIGARRGEVCPLRWEDIHDDQNGPAYIEIKRELIYVAPGGSNPKGYCRIVEHTKTSMDRRVPIWDEMEEFLVRLRAVHTIYYPKSEFLFPGKIDKGCLGYRGTYALFYKICQDHNIPITRDCIRGTHAFRRNFAKRIDDAEMASKLLGNQPRILKKNYYNGLNMEKAKDILDSVSVNEVTESNQ